MWCGSPSIFAIRRPIQEKPVSVAVVVVVVVAVAGQLMSEEEQTLAYSRAC